MFAKPLNRIEALYLRIHDTPDEQAYVSIETSDAKHLTLYAWEKFSEVKRFERETARLTEQLRIARDALEAIRGVRGTWPTAQTNEIAREALIRMSAAE